MPHVKEQEKLTFFACIECLCLLVLVRVSQLTVASLVSGSTPNAHFSGTEFEQDLPHLHLHLQVLFLSVFKFNFSNVSLKFVTEPANIFISSLVIYSFMSYV